MLRDDYLDNGGDFEILDWSREYWPIGLTEIPQPPHALRIRGHNFEFESNHKILCIVGPRKFSDYGERTCREIVAGLAGYPISIVSGLAFGIDSIAHRSALEANLHAIAFPGSGLGDSVIYPAAHFNLAREILQSGGMLLSEFPDNFSATPWGFPQRNRLMVGISDAVLIIEGAEKSGTMITARMAIDYNRDLAAVPGSIFSGTSAGSNRLIKEGAFPVRNSRDILELLGFDVGSEFDLEENSSQNKKLIENLSPEEKLIYDKIPGCDTVEKLIENFARRMDVADINRVISSLEIKGIIKFIGSKINL